MNIRRFQKIAGAGHESMLGYVHGGGKICVMRYDEDGRFRRGSICHG